MKALEFIVEAKVSVKDQIIAAVKNHGGSVNNYFVRFTDIDRLGFSAKQSFGRTLDVDHPKFDLDYIGTGLGRPALWFYPLNYYLKSKDIYATEKPYVWLVKLKPRAWLQTVDAKTKSIEPAPQGLERVGILRQSTVPAAIFFKPAFELIDKFYDYGSQHQTHGQVKGAPKPSWFDKIRGHA